MRPKNHHIAMWFAGLRLQLSRAVNVSVSVFPGEQSCCSRCRERLRSQHTHFGQWKSELQQFLLKYTEIPASCTRSIRRGFDVGEYIPRWIKHGIEKPNQCQGFFWVCVCVARGH